MEVEVPRGVLFIEARVNCLECQYLHKPNPAEDSFMCLKSLQRITHELDEPFTCKGFDDLQVNWVPLYVERTGAYT